MDSCEHLCSNYSVGRRSKRFLLAISNHFINVSAINLYIVFKINTKETIERRIFLKNLAENVVTNQIIRRGNNIHVLRSLGRKIWIYLGNRGIKKPQVTDEMDDTGDSKKRKRCHICPNTKDNIYSYVCKVCKKIYIKIHSASVRLKCEEII